MTKKPRRLFSKSLSSHAAVEGGVGALAATALACVVRTAKRTDGRTTNTQVPENLASGPISRRKNVELAGRQAGGT